MYKDIFKKEHIASENNLKLKIVFSTRNNRY